MHRLAPLLVTLIVSTIDVAYGRFAWSWLAGPIAGLALWSLRDVAKQPATPAPARTGRASALKPLAQAAAVDVEYGAR